MEESNKMCGCAVSPGVGEADTIHVITGLNKEQGVTLRVVGAMRGSTGFWALWVSVTELRDAFIRQEKW